MIILFLSTMKDDLLNVFVKELIKIKKNCTTKKKLELE